MKRTILIIIILLNNISAISQNNVSKLNKEIPFLKEFTTESKLKDFIEKFPDYKFNRKVKPNVSSYKFGKINFNNIVYLFSGHFNEKGQIVLIRLVSEIKNQPLEQYNKIIKILDSKLTSFNKKKKESNDIFLQQISYTKENKEYWASLVSEHGENKNQSISLGIKIEPINDIIEKQEFRKRLENLKTKYGEDFAPYIIQGMISIGMTKEMVIESLGKPSKTNTSNYENKISQQLVYYFTNKTIYVYLDNGKVISYQESEK